MVLGSTMMHRRARWLLALACALGLDGGPRMGLACTTIGVGKDASVDGSTMTTHNADCLSCDFRLGRVPARDWPAGSKRPVIKFRAEFPRTVSEDRGFTWTPENLDPELPQRDVWLDDSWRESMVLGHIPQVNHTFAYLEGLYAIINEKQVAIGESTCSAKWFAGPLSDDCDNCKAMFDISELSRVALERSSTAREAIQIMGDLAVAYGFYGSAWDPEDSYTYDESGEALTISDPQEVWVLHMLADDTSKSAVWAAQRVPDDHVSVVANQFVIREVYPDADPDEFMFSDNLFEVAERGGCGYVSGSGSPLHFTEAFNYRPGDYPHYPYSTRRVWRVFDLFAPSLGLSPFIDTLGRGHPFSVKPDELVSTQDVLKVVRDHYEGTEFDLTTGVAAGPFGDVDRYDIGVPLDGSVDLETVKKGFYERAISVMRLSYGAVAQSRSKLPDEVGALLWATQYKTSTATYMPLYVAIEEVPVPLTKGSLLRFDRESSYWAFNVVGNWAERFRMFSHKHIVAQQATLEDPLFASQAEVESTAAGLVNNGHLEAAVAMLTKRSNDSTVAAVSSYHKLFETLVAKYHDGYEMQDPTAERVTMSKMFYPKWWLEVTGFFYATENDEKATKARGISPYGDDPVSAPTDFAKTPASAHQASASSPPSSWGGGMLGGFMAAAFFTVIGVAVGRWSARRGGYSSLSGPA